MNIQDNILKQYLKNVYFVCGTACGGAGSQGRTVSRLRGGVRPGGVGPAHRSLLLRGIFVRQ